jgi:hypothetical protein
MQPLCEAFPNFFFLRPEIREGARALYRFESRNDEA